ncbi:MAG: ACP phosphodiesterase [Porphyrobacter sp.]|nr:ACP phosphodiesterase [Porphyrobacter sp.]
MAQPFDIAVILGSLRAEGLSRRTAQALARAAPASLTLHPLAIGDLPLYNPDFEEAGRSVPAWEAFRAGLRAADGVLFVTPEYNRSVPAALKNAIDVGSRPYGRSAWAGKPSGIVSMSPGAMGGFGANHHLRQSLVFLDMPVLQQPEAYIGGAGELFGPRGEVHDEAIAALLSGFMEAFARWVGLHVDGSADAKAA